MRPEATAAAGLDWRTTDVGLTGVVGQTSDVATPVMMTAIYVQLPTDDGRRPRR